MADEYNDLLSTFGVPYPNPPAVTPALLAFLRGLSMTMATAGDVRNRALSRIEEATRAADSDITRSAGRTKQNVTADLVRRGVLSSGEANTRYARQSEDVSASRTDLARSSATGKADAEFALRQQRDVGRSQAIDRLIATEQDQATRQAAAAATAEGYQKQQELIDRQTGDLKAANDDFLNRLTGIYKSAGAQGISP